MAECSFSFGFPMGAQDLIRRVEEAIHGAGGTFSGDTTSGSYSIPTPFGSIEGTYFLSGQSIHIDVNRKPAFLSRALIERTLNELIRRG